MRKHEDHERRGRPAVAVFHDLTELQAGGGGDLFDLVDDLYGAAGPVDLGALRSARNGWASLQNR